jgi:hypothetical protein
VRIATIALVASASTACSVGAAGRMELSYDFDRAPLVTASADGSIGAGGFEMPEHASTQDATFGLLRFGFGWGATGAFMEVALEAISVPAPGGGTGPAAGIRVRFDRSSCVRWSVGLGGARLIAQTHAEDLVDQFGPNPRVTRVYQSAGAFAGFASCDRTGFRGMVGAGYEAGVAKLLFAPGP